MPSNFWTEADERHREIAREFYKSVEYDHPDSVSSDRLAPYSNAGVWNTTSVTYYQYTGPAVQSLG